MHLVLALVLSLRLRRRAGGDAERLPKVAEVLAPILGRVQRQRQPLLIAIAERMAAERYRGWADAAELQLHRSGLLACATREEEIAERIEALHPDAASIQGELLAENPELEGINRDLFAGRPLRAQLTLQAEGERLGAATWRAFAAEASEPARGSLLACALLEEESALVLEAILDLER
jgi:hypothetical protein